MRSLRLISLVALVGAVADLPARAETGRLDVLRSDASLVELRWTCESPEIQAVSGDDAAFRRPEVLGGLYLADPGTPDLPTILQLIGIPEGPLPTVRIVSVSTGEMPLPDLAPAPAPFVKGQGRAAEGAETRRRTTFAPGVVPAAWAEITGETWLRGQRMARLAIHPCRYDGARGQLSWARELVLRLEFPATGARAQGEARRDQADWERVMDTTIPNADVARAWRRPRREASAASRGASASFTSAPTWIRVPITEAGVYRLDYFTFANLGIDPGSIDPLSIRVFSGRNTTLPIDLLASPPDDFMTECAIKDLGDGDTVFDVTDRFLLYALGPEGWANEYDGTRSRTDFLQNKYGNETWYWITWGESSPGSFPAPPKRMAARNVADSTSAGWASTTPDRQHFERNSTESFAYRSEDGWMWEDLRGRGDDRRYLLDVESAAVPPGAQGGDGFIQARLYSQPVVVVFGQPPRDQRSVELKVNGVPLVRWEWLHTQSTARQDVSACFQNALVSGPNDIRVDAVTTNTAAVDFLYTGWFDIEYERDLVARNGWLKFFTDPSTPVLPQPPNGTAGCTSLPPGLVYGQRAFRLAGFDAPASEIFLFDVSDQHDIVDLVGFNVQDAGAPHHIRFSDLAPGGIVWYVAVTLDGVKPLPAGRIATIRGLRAAANGTEYLIINHPDFHEGAERLADLRDERWGRNASMVVDVDDVYQEFSWGMKDPVAVRDFLAYTQDRWTNGSPLYLALIGDSAFDTKHFLPGSPPDLLPTYTDRYLESSVEDAGAENVDFYSTDDFFAYLDPEDYAPTSQPSVDVAVGRYPVSTSAQLDRMLDKLQSYLRYRTPGIWQNRMLLVADDERTLSDTAREPEHTVQVETLAQTRVPKALDKVKVYLVNYPRNVFGKKPEATEAFIEEFNRGALMTTYTGHGDQSTMSQEEVFVTQKIADLRNEERYTIFSTFSCTVSRFDLISGASLTELLLDYEGGGAVTTFASGGLVFGSPSAVLNQVWIGEIYGTPHVIPTFARDPRPLGLAALTAKGITGGSLRENNEKYVLLGDPALEVRFGRRLVQFDSPTVNALTTDPSGLLRRVTGSIADSSGAVLDGTNGRPSFDGKAFVHVSELADTTGYDYLSSLGAPFHIPFVLEGATAYRGEVPVVNGRFETLFYLNEGIQPGNIARISVFALQDGNIMDGSGAYDSLVVAPTISPSQVQDTQGPVIGVHFEGYEGFVDGDQLFTDSPVALLTVEDDHGINLRPFPQFARLEAELDDQERIDLVDDFSYESGSFTRGQVRRLLALGGGQHTLEIKAYDNVGNRGTKRVQFTIVLPGGALELVDRNVAVYPNPFTRRADFLYRLTQDADVSLKIFTITGRPIREMKGAGRMGDNVLGWDGTDQRGLPLANGTYLYKLKAERRDADGEVEKDEYVGKVVRMR